MRTAKKTCQRGTVRVIDEEPEMDFSREFTFLWEDYRNAVAFCRKKLSPKSLHRLRIALRKLSVALELCRAAYPAQEAGASVRCIKKQLKKLGPLRDIHTQLEDVEKHEEEWPALGRYGKMLEAERKPAGRRLGRFLCKLKLRKIKILVCSAWNPAIEANPKAGTAQGRALAPVRHYLNTLWGETRRRLSAMDARQLASLHHLRMAIKRLRYTSELLKPLLNPREKQTIRQLAAWQMQLGRVQDRHIMLVSLQKWLKGQSAAIQTEFKVPCRELKRRLNKRAAFLADKMRRVPPGLKTGRRGARRNMQETRPRHAQSMGMSATAVDRRENGFVLF